MRRRTIPLLVSLTLLLITTPAIFAAPPAQFAPPEPADPDEPKLVPIASALSVLRREVATSFRRGHDWPRETANFAEDQNWQVDPADIRRVLLRRLDHNPAVEGYLKWQLLSFKPDLSLYDLEQWERVISTAPRPLTIPSPTPRSVTGGDFHVRFFTGRQLAYVRSVNAVVGDGVAVYRPRIGVVSSGGVLDIHGAARPDFSAEGVVQLNRELADARRHVRNANRPLFVYRDHLLRQVPAGNGLRFAAILREVNQRFDAHDPSAVDLLKHLLQIGPTLIDDIDDATRETLIDWTDSLSRRQFAYTKAFDTDLNGNLVANLTPFQLPEDDLAKLFILLRNPEAYRRRHPPNPDPPADPQPNPDLPLPPQDNT